MPANDRRPALTQGEVCVFERNHEFQRDIYSDHHQLLADEPLSHHGTDLGFDPYELLMASLGACTSMTVRMYASHKGWPLDNVEVHLHHEKVPHNTADPKGAVTDRVTRTVRVTGALSEDQRARLLDVANKCPLYRTLTGQLQISTTLALDGAA